MKTDAPLGKQAIANALLIKEGIARITRKAIFWKNASMEKEVVRIRPQYSTACCGWRPNFFSIYIGANILDEDSSSLMRPGLTDELKIEYIGKFYQHEKGHVYYTTKDLRVVNKLLQQLKTPFEVFNLLEDARIEHLIRAYNYLTFNWLKFETQNYTADPSTWLFSMIQCEGDESLIAEYKEKVRASLSAGDLEVFDSRFERVKYYFDTVRKMTTYQQVCLLSRSWVDEFGAPPKSNKGSKSGPGSKFDSELQEVAVMQGNPAAQAILDAECDNFMEDLSHSDPDAPDKPDASDKAGSDSDTSEGKLPLSVELAHASSFFDGQPFPVDIEEAQRCADVLAKVLVPKMQRQSSSSPSRRLNMKAYGKGKIAFYHNVPVSRKGKKYIVMVLDCSGSMNGVHIREAKVLIYAMSLLVSRGLLEADIIFSKISGSTGVNAKVSLPIALSDIEKIGATGSGEGLEYTISNHFRTLKAADHAWVFTDGNITDKPLDKQAIHAKGLELVGIYASDVDTQRTKLERFFNKVVLRHNAFEILKLLLIDLA